MQPVPVRRSGLAGTPIADRRRQSQAGQGLALPALPDGAQRCVAIGPQRPRAAAQRRGGTAMAQPVAGDDSLSLQAGREVHGETRAAQLRGRFDLQLAAIGRARCPARSPGRCRGPARVRRRARRAAAGDPTSSGAMPGPSSSTEINRPARRSPSPARSLTVQSAARCIGPLEGVLQQVAQQLLQVAGLAVEMRRRRRFRIRRTRPCSGRPSRGWRRFPRRAARWRSARRTAHGRCGRRATAGRTRCRSCAGSAPSTSRRNSVLAGAVVQARTQHRQRRLQAVRQVGQGVAALVEVLALAFDQGVDAAR